MQEEKRRGQIAGIVMMVLLLLWVGAMGAPDPGDAGTAAAGG